MAYKSIEWMEGAFCSNPVFQAEVPPAWFHLEKGAEEQTPTGQRKIPYAEVLERQNAAQGLCAVCPVRTDCLDYALADPTMYAIWGGSTRGQRKLIHRGKVTVAQHFAWLDGEWANTMKQYRRPYALGVPADDDDTAQIIPFPTRDKGDAA